MGPKAGGSLNRSNFKEKMHKKNEAESRKTSSQSEPDVECVYTSANVPLFL